MEQVKIQNIKISKFKNLIDKEMEIDPNAKVVLFKGRNGIGKSNILNAIYWCLTGVDLNNSSDTESFIPKTLRNADGVVVDVEVTFNVFTLRRTITRTPKGNSESIYINNILLDSLKAGEIEIDGKLGLLPYTLSSFTNKDFSMRRFAMNPNYIYGLAPKTIRDVLVKKYNKQITDEFEKEIMEKPLIKDTLSKYAKITEIAETGINHCLYSKIQSVLGMCDAKLKASKTTVDQANTTLLVLRNLPKEPAQATFDAVENLKVSALQEFTSVESDKKILETAMLEFDRKFEELIKKEHPIISIEFLKTNSKGVTKPAIEISSNDILLNHRSTSESVFDALNLMFEYFKMVGYDVSLPIFIDRAESMTLSRLYYLCEGNNQVFATVVSEGYGDNIEMEVL